VGLENIHESLAHGAAIGIFDWMKHGSGLSAKQISIVLRAIRCHTAMHVAQRAAHRNA
jgi:hypothetical protein